MANQFYDMPPIIKPHLRFRLTLTLTVIVAVGCVLPQGYVGEVRDIDDGRPRSGERLRMRWYVAEGGARILADILDTTTDAPCRFVRAEDGEMRCLPFAAPVSYLDEGCTQPVVVVDDGSTCSVGETHQMTVTSSCDERPTTSLFRRGEMLQGDGPYFVNAPGLGCVADSRPGTAYAVEPVDPSAFVRATWASELHPEGIVARRLDGEDGSSIIGELVDTERDRPCAPRAVGDIRCVPERAAPTLWLGNFVHADSECSEPAGVAWSHGECPPDLIDDPFGVYSPGERLEQAWSMVEGECVPLDPGFPVYAAGPEIPFEAFPLLDSEVTGEGRLSATWRTDRAGRIVWPYGSLYDTSWNADCFLVEDQEGVVRCLPNDESAWPAPVWVYNDEGCSERLLYLESWVFGGLPFTAELDVDPCGNTRLETLYRIGEELEPQQVWIDAEGECVPVDSSGFAIYPVTEVDPSVLPAVSVVQD